MSPKETVLLRLNHEASNVCVCEPTGLSLMSWLIGEAEPNELVNWLDWG